MPICDGVLPDRPSEIRESEDRLDFGGFVGINNLDYDCDGY